MAGKAIELHKDAHVDLGIVQIPVDVLKTLTGEDYAKTGVILANKRIKLTLMHGNVPVAYTLSLYAQREAMSEAEQAKVDAVKVERVAKAKAKADDEQSKRERESRRAFELGQEATFGALKNLSVLAESAKALAKLAK